MAFPHNFTCTSWSIYGFRFRLIAYSARFLYCSRAVSWVDLGALLWEATFGSWVCWYSFIRCFHVFMESYYLFLVYFQGVFCCYELCIPFGPVVPVGAWLSATNTNCTHVQCYFFTYFWIFGVQNIFHSFAFLLNDVFSHLSIFRTSIKSSSILLNFLLAIAFIFIHSLRESFDLKLGF